MPVRDSICFPSTQTSMSVHLYLAPTHFSRQCLHNNILKSVSLYNHLAQKDQDHLDERDEAKAREQVSKKTPICCRWVVMVMVVSSKQP
jgi:hypothetical protein